jgi:hypothetical protein
MVDTDRIGADNSNPIVVIEECHIKWKARNSELIYCLAVRHISHDHLTVLVGKSN